MFRAAIFAGVLLALWTLGRPANAATLAPFCDDRGATALAQPPALEASDEAIRQAAAPRCETDALLPSLASTHAHRTARAVPADPAAIDAGSPSRPLPPLVDRIVPFVALDTPPPAGVPSRVERPPRG